MRTLSLLVAAVVSCLVATASAEAHRPNIVFLLADDMRPDALGMLGHPVVKTPNIDTLAAEGTLFTRAIVGYPICHVSRAEILTGCCAFQTGVQYHGTRIDSRLALWPETFRRAGYHTMFSGKWHNDGQPTQRGFAETGGLFSSGGAKGRRELPDHAGRPATGYTGWTFKSNDGQVEVDKGVGLTPDTDRFITDGALEVLQRHAQEPFFLQVSFTGPHDPRIWPRGRENEYAADRIPLPRNFAPQHPFDHGNAAGRDEVLLSLPRQPEEIRAELAVYYAVITNLDAQVGRIVSALRELGVIDNTIIVFSSDHGLALGSHGLTGKQNMYEHTIGVPLVMRGPGIPKGHRSAAQCYLRDLFPTACELCGIAVPDTVQSRSIAPILSGKSKSLYSEVYACFTDTQRMIRDERWKLNWYPKIQRTQLFDLANDPDELHDLSSDPRQADKSSELKRRLSEWLKANGDPLADVH